MFRLSRSAFAACLLALTGGSVLGQHGFLGLAQFHGGRARYESA